MADTTITLTATAAPVSGGEQTPHVRRYTAHDAQERTIRYLGANASKSAKEDARIAIYDAYREITTAAHWTYLWASTRLNLNGVYSTGTIAYDHTGGAYERMVTLTSGTWPSWARLGRLVIAGISYKPERRISDSIIVLDSVQNPGADVASSTSYSLYQDTYELPTDFWATEAPNREAIGGMRFVRPQMWASRIRYIPDVSGIPLFYTLTGGEGRIVMQVNPPSEEDRTIDLLYLRKPRQISTWDYSTGKATVNTGTFPKRVTLTDGGTFTAGMVGSVIRLSSAAATLPTGYEGDNPPAEERTIKVYISSTQVEVDEDFDASYTETAYRISDPIDIEDLQMNAFWRCVEKQSCITRIMKETRDFAFIAYQQALALAREADSRILERRSAGDGNPYWPRTKDLPLGDDTGTDL